MVRGGGASGAQRRPPGASEGRPEKEGLETEALQRHEEEEEVLGDSGVRVQRDSVLGRGWGCCIRSSAHPLR